MAEVFAAMIRAAADASSAGARDFLTEAAGACAQATLVIRPCGLGPQGERGTRASALK